MSATTDDPASARAARGGEMPAGAMNDTGESPPRTGEMPSGTMDGDGGGETAIAGYSAGGIGSTAGEMPSGSMTDTAVITPGVGAGEGEMPGGEIGTSSRTAGEMPGEGAGAVPTSPPTVEISAGPWRVTISPS